MKHLYYSFLLLGLTFGLTSCLEPLPAPEPPKKDSVIKNVYTGSALEITGSDPIENVLLREGNKLVFNYRFHSPGNPNTTDDDVVEQVMFEVPLNVEEFFISDFEASRAVFRRRCSCDQNGYTYIKVGSIRGRKIDRSNWEVEMAVAGADSKIDFALNVSGIFKM